MSAELQRLIDEAAIIRVKNEYAWARDNADIDAFMALYAPDARTRLGFMGSADGIDEIRANLEARLPQSPRGTRAHVLSNPVIDIDGDTARGRWYIQVHRIDPETGERSISIIGRYEDEFRRVDGKWLITLVSLDILWRG